MGIFDGWFSKSKNSCHEDVNNIFSQFNRIMDDSPFDFAGHFNRAKDFISFSSLFDMNNFNPYMLRGNPDSWNKLDKDFDDMIEQRFQDNMKDSSKGVSVEIKSIMGSDGIVQPSTRCAMEYLNIRSTFKKMETIRKSDGTEKTRIINRKGDKDYIIERFRDKNGKEEVKESTVNNNISKRKKVPGYLPKIPGDLLKIPGNFPKTPGKFPKTPKKLLGMPKQPKIEADDIPEDILEEDDDETIFSC